METIIIFLKLAGLILITAILLPLANPLRSSNWIIADIIELIDDGIKRWQQRKKLKR